MGEQACSSSSASSLRIVEGPQWSTGSAASDFDATGWPVRRSLDDLAEDRLLAWGEHRLIVLAD